MWFPRPTRPGLLLAGAMVAILAQAGCQGTMFARPPGSMQNQQNMASLFDPYPDNQMGPNTLELRPREFATPWSEPRRAQYYSEISGRGRRY